MDKITIILFREGETMGPGAQIVVGGLNSWGDFYSANDSDGGPVAKSTNDRITAGRKPNPRNRPPSLSSRSLSRAVVKPRQAREAYNIEAMVVERATTCSWGLPSP